MWLEERDRFSFWAAQRNSGALLKDSLSSSGRIWQVWAHCSLRWCLWGELAGSEMMAMTLGWRSSGE